MSSCEATPPVSGSTLQSRALCHEAAWKSLFTADVAHFENPMWCNVYINKLVVMRRKEVANDNSLLML